MLRLSKNPDRNYTDTMWLTFASTLDDMNFLTMQRAAGADGGMRIQDVSALADQAVPDEWMGLAERQWTKELAEGGFKEDGGGQMREEVDGGEVVLDGQRGRMEGWEWAQDRMVLLVGSSRKSHCLSVPSSGPKERVRGERRRVLSRDREVTKIAADRQMIETMQVHTPHTHLESFHAYHASRDPNTSFRPRSRQLILTGGTFLLYRSRQIHALGQTSRRDMSHPPPGPAHRELVSVSHVPSACMCVLDENCNICIMESASRLRMSAVSVSVSRLIGLRTRATGSRQATGRLVCFGGCVMHQHPHDAAGIEQT